MILNDYQQDALSELINIAFSRTAASLSDLTGQRVQLNAPHVKVRPLNELTSILDDAVSEEDVATVHQVFSGPLSGDAFLLLSYSDAVKLTNLLTDIPQQSNRLDASSGEVLTEVGNILLNASLSIFGNILKMHITFAVPRLHLDAIHALLESIMFDSEEVRYAMIVFTSFHLRDSSISGYLVVILGITSLESLIQSIEELG